MSITKQRFVIIGGSSGMGLALAKKVVQAGGEVVLCGRSSSKLEAAVSTLAELGGVASYQAFDASVSQDVINAFIAIGTYDHLVVTAADLTFAPLAQLNTNDIQRMLNSKFWGPVNAAKYGLNLINRKGSVTFFSGLAAYRPAVGTTIVAALNAGLEGFAMALALEVKPLRVNVISPGVVDTPTWSFLSDEERVGLFDDVAKGLPVGHVGRAEDLAGAALSVVENPFINATVLHVDGGGRVA
ncbi:SDR family oxidoreductase [Pseudomonas shirazensis]|uniref:SDR family oxidoreductase n=1 Tax=Pseudomonas shirazensis TaxID=2745494 RepID=UPI003D270C6D